MTGLILIDFDMWKTLTWEVVDVDVLLNEAKQLHKDTKALSKTARSFDVYR